MRNKIQPRLPKGTRDFSPGDMAIRNHIIGTIRSQFKLFGFREIETPAIENLETLTGKYGEEGDQLIFKILNSGDYLKNVPSDVLNKGKVGKITGLISEKALRYDLTVPFARYVVQHRNDITFPFRRFQIQPVWRADRPQKGRYREFYQCDADIIGSDSLLLESELIELIARVLNELEIPATIRLNSRKILMGFCEEHLAGDQFISFTTILDKLDKKPWDALKMEFIESGFSESAIQKVADFVGIPKSSDDDPFERVSDLVSVSEIGREGLMEMKTVLDNSQLEKGGNLKLNFDPSLARGLTYYTGAIIEVIADDEDMGSICGGGRYDDLTGIFGWEDISGIGISFGIDRLFDILKDSGKIEQDIKEHKVVCLNFGEKEVKRAKQVAEKIRESGFVAEVYPDPVKLQKQFKFADQIGASHVLIIGEEELIKDTVQLKNLKTGEQLALSVYELQDHLKKTIV